MSEFSAGLECLTLRQIMGKHLSIPSYQRTYTWNSTHVIDLLKDIANRNRPYLLGTVILHDNEEALQVVDGQQRLVTLTVLLKELGVCELPLLENASFSAASAGVIKNTQKVISEFLRGKDRDKERLKCWLWADVSHEKPASNTVLFSVLTLKGDNALDRAYTFFDSFNSKGKPLTDFDLLKAHHLMFIPPEQEELAQLHNDEWQRRDETHSILFTQCLRRLRMWARRVDRDTKGERPDYNEFVSISDPGETADHEHPLTRYMQPAVFRSWRRDGTRIILSMDYPMHASEELIPTEVSQSIEGGDPFFIYAKRYHALNRRLFDSTDKTVVVSTGVKFIRRLVECFNVGYRSTAYLKDVLRPILLLYVDKFGEDRLVDAAVCMERIISSKLWEAPRNGLRIEGVLSHVKDKDIVPALLNATTTLHAVTILFGKAQHCMAPKQDTNLKIQHFGRMREFYVGWLPYIADMRIHNMTMSAYLNNNEGLSR